MKFDVPSGVSLSDVAVVGAQSVRVADRAQAPGFVTSSAGSVTVGNDASIETVSARSSIALGDRAKVKGSVQAGTTLTKASLGNNLLMMCIEWCSVLRGIDKAITV